MKTSKDFSRNKISLILVGLITLYIALLSFFHIKIFTTKFDPTLINRYFLSQSITHEVPGKRLFLSDAEVYTATGYMYVHGQDPAEFNFEHPPFVKYLFGLSILLFNNPLAIQVILGSLVLATVFFLGLQLFKKMYTASLATLLLLIDPLFIDVSSQALLDMGQLLFLLLYIWAVLFHKKNFALQGVLLGLFAGTKFWVAPMLVIGVFTVYKLYKKDFDYKIFGLHLLVSIPHISCSISKPSLILVAISMSYGTRCEFLNTGFSTIHRPILVPRSCSLRLAGIKPGGVVKNGCERLCGHCCGQLVYLSTAHGL